MKFDVGDAIIVEGYSKSYFKDKAGSYLVKGLGYHYNHLEIANIDGSNPCSVGCVPAVSVMRCRRDEFLPAVIRANKAKEKT